MRDAFLCDAIRTPFGRYAGVLAGVRTDDLAAIPIGALLARNPSLDAAAIDDVVLGCANQAGEDNRNVARMALLLAGVPQEVPGVTVNRLCGSGLDAVGIAARAIRSGEAELVIAGGVESMTRAPYVFSKSATPFARNVEMFDTTFGWRFVNPLLKTQYGVDSMADTAENVASEYHVARADQDRFALRSQERALAAQSAGRLAEEIIAVSIPGRKKGESQRVDRDEHPRATSLEALAALPASFREGGSVTAGNASGINDGAAALLLASEAAVTRYGLTARARVAGAAVAGVAPRIMVWAPLQRYANCCRVCNGHSAVDVLELNEAFAAQALAVMRELGLPDDAPQVNPNGGAIALGHPLGASGARLVITALHQLRRTGGSRALCAMCIGVGQGIALAIERT